MRLSPLVCFLWTVGRVAALAFAVAHLSACGIPPFDALSQQQAEADSDSVHFQRVSLHTRAGPCTEEMDCEGFYEMLADGTFRVDRFGEYQGGVHEAHLSAEDLESAIQVATNPELVKRLRGGSYPCGHVTDVSNDFVLDLEGEHLVQEVTVCNWPEVQAIREKLRDLEDRYTK